MKRKLLILFFALINCVALAFGLTACGENNGGGNTGESNTENGGGTTNPPAHTTHTYGEWTSDGATTHSRVCSCNDKQTQDHTWNAGETTKKATCKEAGITTYTCTVCGETKTESISKLTTHTYGEWTSDGTTTHSRTCSVCQTTETKPHEFTDRICVCGEKDTALHGVELKAEGFEKNGTDLYTKVSNATETFSFRSGISVAEDAIYRIYSDIQCKNEIASKTDNIKIGDNILYILVTSGNDLELYTATVRRRPIYTVSFNTNGGTAVESQQVEEDSLATQPESTKTGYTFVAWDYDFNEPITKDETVSASWKANGYTLTFDVNGGDALAPQAVTYNAAFTLPKATRTGYTFVGWFDGETQLKDNAAWNKLNDFSVTAKWRINSYRLSVNYNSAAGSVTGTDAGTYDYNTPVSLTASAPNLGYEWLGWYKGETLLSADSEFSTAIPAENVTLTAKFQVLESMRYFNFTSTKTTCQITGVKNKTVTEIVIPDFVTSIGSYAFYNCSGLTSITIPDSVTSIGNSAFEGCSGLTSVTIGNGVTSIGDCAFYNCSGLTSITIPDSVTSIEYQAFYNCSGLTSITIPDSMTSIEYQAFYNCSGLTSITIPDRESISYLHPTISC